MAGNINVMSGTVAAVCTLLLVPAVRDNDCTHQLDFNIVDRRAKLFFFGGGGASVR